MRKAFYFVSSLRPKQWIKNVFIFGPVIFSLHMFDWPYLRPTFMAFIIFSLIAGCIYVFNDILDREKDRFHPEKRKRPIASGKIDPLTAGLAGAGVLAISLFLAFRLHHLFFLICLSYAALFILYSLYLKDVVIIDVMTIAFGFVLRVMAGGAVCGIWLSPWILISTFLLSLFLALIKRRQELIKVGNSGDAGSTRSILKCYSVGMLDQMISISTATTLIAYIMYALSPEVQDKFHSKKLFYTVPFVIFAIFRYLFLSYTMEEGESPSEIIYTDIPFSFNLLLWLAVTIYLIKLHP